MGPTNWSQAFTLRSVSLRLRICIADFTDSDDHHIHSKTTLSAVPAPVLTTLALSSAASAFALSASCSFSPSQIPGIKFPKHQANTAVDATLSFYIEAAPSSSTTHAGLSSCLRAASYFRGRMLLLQWSIRRYPPWSVQHRLFMDAVYCLLFGFRYLQTNHEPIFLRLWKRQPVMLLPITMSLLCSYLKVKLFIVRQVLIHIPDITHRVGTATQDFFCGWSHWQPLGAGDSSTIRNCFVFQSVGIWNTPQSAGWCNILPQCLRVYPLIQWSPWCPPFCPDHEPW